MNAHNENRSTEELHRGDGMVGMLMDRSERVAMLGL